MGKDKLENMLAYLTGGSSRSDKACTDLVNAALAAIYDMFHPLYDNGEKISTGGTLDSEWPRLPRQ